MRLQLDYRSTKINQSTTYRDKQRGWEIPRNAIPGNYLLKVIYRDENSAMWYPINEKTSSIEKPHKVFTITELSNSDYKTTITNTPQVATASSQIRAIINVSPTTIPYTAHVELMLINHSKNKRYKAYSSSPMKNIGNQGITIDETFTISSDIEDGEYSIYAIYNTNK